MHCSVCCNFAKLQSVRVRIDQNHTQIVRMSCALGASLRASGEGCRATTCYKKYVKAVKYY